jgi:hypothetical protein
MIWLKNTITTKTLRAQRNTEKCNNIFISLVHLSVLRVLVVFLEIEIQLHFYNLSAPKCA